jgi:UDP-hydrolysing UDP-N-acetyl-D-glucosamine 2-epimerase
MKRRICVTTGGRSEYGILRPVIKAIKESKKLDLCLLVSGMHLSKKHGFTIKEIQNDGFRIYDTVNMIPKGDSTYHMSLSLGNGILRFSDIFRKLKPDINLILGDRDEAFASALAASHMNIPNAHIHGGDKSQGGLDEYNRHAITKISNIHFAASKKSKERIIKMGEDPEHVFITGSPAIDEIAQNKITGMKELEEKYGIKFSNGYMLLLQHPVTTEFGKVQDQIRNILEAIVKTKKQTIIIAPNSDAGNSIIYKNIVRYSKIFPFIKWYPTLPRNDYLGILKNSKVLLGNSSSGIIEAGYFGVPFINMGIRQNGRESTKNVINVKDISENLIYRTICQVLKRKPHPSYDRNIYGNGNASKKIVQVLEEIQINDKLIQKQIFY